MAKLKLYESDAWLRMMYSTKRMSIDEMAEAAKCSPNSIRKGLKRLGLIR